MDNVFRLPGEPDSEDRRVPEGALVTLAGLSAVGHWWSDREKRRKSIAGRIGHAVDKIPDHAWGRMGMAVVGATAVGAGTVALGGITLVLALIAKASPIAALIGALVTTGATVGGGLVVHGVFADAGRGEIDRLRAEKKARKFAKKAGLTVT
jgi:hypothetical protein